MGGCASSASVDGASTVGAQGSEAPAPAPPATAADSKGDGMDKGSRECKEGGWVNDGGAAAARGKDGPVPKQTAAASKVEPVEQVAVYLSPKT